MKLAKIYCVSSLASTVHANKITSYRKENIFRGSKQDAAIQLDFYIPPAPP